MTPFEGLLLLAAVAVPLNAWLAAHGTGRWLLVAVYAIQLVLLALHDPTSAPALSGPTLLGLATTWQLGPLGWFFAMITLGIASCASVYAAGEWGDRFQADGGAIRWLFAGLQLNLLAMLLLLSAGDLLAFFIAWELTSWAALALMLPGGTEVRQAAMRYVLYALAGGMALFAAVGLTYAAVGSLAFGDIVDSIPGWSTGFLWLVTLTALAGFSIKMAILPFHLWQPPAYAFSPGPASAFLSAISARMGLYATALVLFQFIGLAGLGRLVLVPDWFDLQDALAWAAALTAILPTYVAMRQNDARLLLAWHGVGQGGFMLLGVVTASSLGSAGGLLHVFNHAGYQALLVMAVFAVLHRTGTADLNRLGGLVARMPLSFLAMLIGIIGLAGLPPINGFVSKWMIYRSLIADGQPLLFIAAVISTLGTILSVYKLIHNTFLGQLRIEHEQVREAPWSMTVPMLILCVVVFVTGMMPGLVLPYVAAAQQAIGLAPVDHILGGVRSDAGGLDMLWVVGVLFAGFGIGALVFFGLGGRSRRVHQLDNYAGGHFLTADVRYQYSDNFYAGLMHRIGPWYRGSFAWAEQALVSAVGALGMLARGFFEQANPASWALIGTTVITTWMMWYALG